MKLAKKINILILALFFMFSILSFPTLPARENFDDFTYADSETENISLSNSDFASSPNSTLIDTNPTGWSVKSNNSRAEAGIINVNPDTFGNNAASYKLEKTANPGKKYTDFDDKVLMINASTLPSAQGFGSANIQVPAYSYYKISVLLKTQSNAGASIYLRGLDDSENTFFENLSPKYWNEYTFFVETFVNAETVYLELWLGTRGGSTSSGMAFYDHITVTKCTKTRWESDYPQVPQASVKKFSNTNRYIPSVQNSDFENKDLTKSWTSVDGLPIGAIAKVINTSSSAELTNMGFSSVGPLPTAEGTNALALGWKKGDTDKKYFGLKSTKFDILTNAYYRVSVNVKVSDMNGGGAFVKIVEDDNIKYFYNPESTEIMDFYTLSVTTSSILSSNSDNKFSNGYQEVSFLVKGHPLFNTKMHLELWLGSESSPVSSGLAVFDRVAIERITSTEFSSISKGSYDSEVNLTTLSGTPTIANGNFDSVSEVKFNSLNGANGEAEGELIIPSNFTFSHENEIDSIAGIANTYSAYYSRFQPTFGIANPGNRNGGIDSTDRDVNNILILRNKLKTYQNFTTETFSMDAGSFYNFSFAYKTSSSSPSSKSKIGLTLSNASGIEIYKNTDISSSLWSTFEVLIKTSDLAETVTAKFNFGDIDDKVMGYAMLDSLKIEKVDEAAYLSASENSDLTGCMMDLTKTTNRFTESPAFTSSSTSTELNVGESGIFNGLHNIYDINYDGNVLGIVNQAVGTYSLSSKFSFQVISDKFYKLTFKLQTIIPENADARAYGAGIELTGLDNSFSELISNGTFREYTMFVKALSTAELKLKMFVQSVNLDTIGSAFFAGISFSESSETEFTEAQNNQSPRVITAASSDGLQEEEETTDTTPITQGESFNFLFIPSLIFGTAIIVAIVGYALRRVKIKKFERKEKSSYDRTITVDYEYVKMEAENRRQTELSALEQELNQRKAELEELEISYKEHLETQRKSKTTGTAIDKQTEKTFKSYALKHTKIQDAIDRLKMKIDNINSPEYIVLLQRKIEAEKAKRKNL